MAAILLASCGPVIIYDTRLQPVVDPVRVASVENGRLAIDSTPAGIRGVLELWIETDARTLDHDAVDVPTLRCEAEGLHLPIRIRREEAVCSPVPPSMQDCQRVGGDGEPCDAYFVAGADRCVQMLRAEFQFRHVPKLDGRLTLAFGQRATPVQWARR
jgi:hypothetical protein